MFNYSFIDKDKIQEDLNKLCLYMREHDNDFTPPISSKVEIEEYVKKLTTHGKVILCNFNDKIIGVAAFYCNSADFAFLSYLSVDKKHRKQGIANKLISRMIKYCETTPVSGIKTNTWKNNKAIDFYKANSFKVIDSLDKNRVDLLYTYTRDNSTKSN